MRRAHELLDVLREPLDLFGGDVARFHELLRVDRPRGRVVRDPLRHQRLRERRLVALVVAVAPVADEIDDDVAAEAPPEGECEPDRRDRGLGVVGVHVDDRRVEALREVARVAGRAPVSRLGREADLVVRDQVERAAGRVADELLEVEGLGDDSLAGEGGVAVDEDRQRNGRILDSGGRRAVGLLRARDAFDDRVDSLEVARVRGEQDGGLAGARAAPADGAQVVLHVAARAFRSPGDRLDRPLALELAKHLLVRPSDDVSEDVEPPAVGHADHDLVGARLGADLDRLVEHRNHHVEAFDRELLLPEELALEVVLEALDLAQPLEQEPSLLGRERLAVPAGLDRVPEPDALLVVRDVLDLVRDRSAVDLAELRQDVGERLALDADAQDGGRNLLLELGRELGDEQLGLQRRVADGLGAEWVEVGGQVAMRAVGLDQRRRRGNCAEQSLVGLGPGGGLRPTLRLASGLGGRLGCGLGGGLGGRLGGGLGLGAGSGAGSGASSRRRGVSRRCCDRNGLRGRFGSLGRRAVLPQRLEQASEAGERLDDCRVAALEERAPFLRNRLRILEVLLEQGLGIARVQSVDVAHLHHVRSTTPMPSGAGRQRPNRWDCSR